MKDNHRNTGIQQRNDKDAGQVIRVSWEKSNGLFEWVLPNGKIELVDEVTFKSRGGKTIEWDLTGFGVKMQAKGHDQAKGGH